MPEQRDPVFYPHRQVFMGPRDSVTCHRTVWLNPDSGLCEHTDHDDPARVDPSLSEVPDAEDGQGGQARQAAGEEAAGDEGGRQVT